MTETVVDELQGSNARPDAPEDAVEEQERDAPAPQEPATRGGPGPTQLSPQGADFIARFEGCVLHLYNDPTGNATIGVGHLVHMGPINGSEPAEFKHGITRERALELLEHDAAKAAGAVLHAITTPLNQAQLDALTSFTFNVGEGNLRASTLRRKLNAGDHAGVPAQLMRWVFSSGKTLPGLVKRRQAEGTLFAHGTYR